jgi:hypothetical protein
MPKYRNEMLVTREYPLRRWLIQFSFASFSLFSKAIRCSFFLTSSCSFKRSFFVKKKGIDGMEDADGVDIMDQRIEGVR